MAEIIWTEIIWTETALANLEDVAEYIALSNPVAAQKLVSNTFDTVGRLREYPESGKIPLEIPEFDYREVVITPLRAFYKYQHNKVYILFIIRQEQDLRRYMLED